MRSQANHTSHSHLKRESEASNFIVEEAGAYLSYVPRARHLTYSTRHCTRCGGAAATASGTVGIGTYTWEC